MTNFYQPNQDSFIRRQTVKKSNERYFKKRGAPTMFLVGCSLLFMLQCAGTKDQVTPEVSMKLTNTYQVSAVEL